MKTVTRFLWCAGALLLLVAGVCCLVSPVPFTAGLYYALGSLVFLSGITTVIAYFQYGRGTFGGGWMLFDGSITLLLGISLLAGELLAEPIKPYLFAVWIFILGVIKLSVALDLNKLGVRRWPIVLLSGVCGIALGMLAAFEPMGTRAVLGILAGVYLLFGGFSSLVEFIFVWRRKNYFMDLVLKGGEVTASDPKASEKVDEGDGHEGGPG